MNLQVGNLQFQFKMLLITAFALLQICCCAPVIAQDGSPNTRKVSRVILDLTTPLNALMGGKMIFSDYITEVDSAVHRTSSNGTIPTLFYASASETFEELVEQIRRVSKIVNETMRTTKGLHLMVSCTIDVLIEQEVSTRLTTLYRPYNPRNIQLSIVYTLHDELNCNNVKNELNGGWPKLLRSSLFYNKSGISEDHNVRLGIGYSESLIDCSTLYLDVMYDTDISFTVLNIKFGATIGVTESYTLFQRRLNFLHNKTRQNHEKWKLKVSKEIIYYPVAESVGENSHCDLLIRYSDTWTSDGINDRSVIVQTPHEEDDTPKKQSFAVIPYLNNYHTGSANTHWGKHRWQYMVPVALETVVKGFNTLLLTHDQWSRLSSYEIRHVFETVKTPSSKVTINIAIDFSDPTAKPNKVRLSGTQKWPAIERELLNRYPDSNSENVVLRALVFQFQNTSSDDYQPLVDPQFARRISSKLMVGCSLRKTSFESLNVTSFIQACKSVNGDFYVFKWALTLEWREDPQDNYLYYENTLRKELMIINDFRNTILLKHHGATISFQLDTVGINVVRKGYAVNDLPSSVVDNSLFCDPMINEINKYFEAMIIWANVHNFPIILNSEYNALYSNNEHTSWFSFLRRYPHFKFEQNDPNLRSLFGEQQGPSFINPDSNLIVDPCIEWTEGRPEIKKDYFKNQNVGAIFHTEDLRKDGDTGQEDFVTMFQFIFNRFDLVEIVSSSNFQEVIEAFDYVSGEHPVSMKNSSIFVSYVASEADTKNELSKFKTFLEDLEGSAMSDSVLVKGIHIELLEYSEYTSQGGELAPIDLSKYSSLRSVFEEQMSENITFGILVELERCWEIVRYLIVTSDPYDKGLELLNKADYLICQTDTGLTHDYKEIQQFSFDRHLYIKRVFKQLLPQLEVYFRTEVDIEVNDDAETMEKYLRILSHYKKFGEAYDVRYFVVEAFDTEEGRKNGWWTMKNFTELTDSKCYVEKEPVYLGRDMWYPPPLPKKHKDTHVYSNSPLVIIGLSASLVLLFLLAVSGTILYIRYKRLGRYLSDEEVDEFVYGRPASENRNTKIAIFNISAAEYLKYNPDFELPLSELNVDLNEVLGKGNFGTVYKGTANGYPAAVKQPNRNCEKSTFKNVLSEIKVLGFIGIHPHIVRFIGAYTKEIRRGFLYIATELCTNGSLERLLRSKKFVASSSESSNYQNIQGKRESLLYSHNLHRFAMEIASGMEYIEKKQVVHGDLSTRNILLDENLTCKIADFGFSRKLYEYQSYVKKSQDPLPWKWMAYESLTKMEFTPKSDVWGYGVTLWEIYSLGETPYGGLHWTQDFADDLRNGLRLKMPHFADETLYHKMLDCWDLEAEQRPTFESFVEFFRQLCDNNYTVLEQADRYYEIRKGISSAEM